MVELSKHPSSRLGLESQRTEKPLKTPSWLVLRETEKPPLVNTLVELVPQSLISLLITNTEQNKG